uniref:Putative secreted protein n=1 Tax=Anopheles darlingi TaxID=43151 RepID=A0A2M4DNY1_ANODA
MLPPLLLLLLPRAGAPSPVRWYLMCSHMCVCVCVYVCTLCARSSLSKVRGISTRENCCTFHHHHHPTSHLSPFAPKMKGK